MAKEATIEVMTPKPFEVVGTKFVLLGKVPKSWLLDGRHGLGVDWLEASGGNLPMSGPHVTTLPTLFPWSKKVRFHSRVDLSHFTTSEHPRGLILVVETYEGKNRSFYHPVIIAGTNKVYESEHTELKEKLSATIKRLIKDKEGWENYTRELETLRKSIVSNKEILEGMFDILELEEESFVPIIQSEEEKQEAELEEKYKEAIESRGPLFRGAAGRMEGFELRVYSDDHGQHFHVVHKGKGINARFSFPEMALLSYISRATIGVKTQKKLREFCKRPDIFENLKTEFAKRLQTL